MPEGWRRAVPVAILALGCVASAAGEGAESPPLVWPRHGEPVLEIVWRAGGKEDPRSTETPAHRVHFPRWSTGERLGSATLHRAWVDARGQRIAAGAYVLRYAVQPLSKDHVGTAAGRDFLVLVPAAGDPGEAMVEEGELWRRGRLASAAAHPAVMEMRRPGGEPAEGETVLATRIDGAAVLLVVEAPARAPGPF